MGLLAVQELSSHLPNGSGGHNGLGSPVPSGPVTQPRLARHSQLGRAQLDDYASRVMALDEEGESFVQKIHRLFTEAGALAEPCSCYVILTDAKAGTLSTESRPHSMLGLSRGKCRLHIFQLEYH